jgi:hypothetical protein
MRGEASVVNPAPSLSDNLIFRDCGSAPGSYIVYVNFDTSEAVGLNGFAGGAESLRAAGEGSQ